MATDTEMQEAIAGFERMVKTAERLLNEIEDTATDGGQSNADLISLLGYMTGMADTVHAMSAGEPAFLALFNAARLAGRRHGNLRLPFLPKPKDNV